MDLRGRTRRRTVLAGRQEELAALEAARRDCARGRLVLVRGPAGIGKSALLEAAARDWRGAGVQVIRASLAGGEDPYGFRALADALREAFERIGEPRLAGPIGALARPAPPADQVPEVAAAFDLVRRRGPVVLVADDADAAAAPALALGAAARPGCLVVVACRDGRHPAATQLGAHADHAVDLPPLPEAEVESLIARVRGARPDAAVMPALRAALGPLLGHPGTVVSTLDDLDRQGRLAALDGHLCLVEPEAPVALPAGHHLLARTRDLGPLAVRLATAVAVAPVPLDDMPLLAEAHGEPVRECGRVADRLVEEGVLAVDGGRLRTACPALAARLVAQAGSQRVAALHRGLAEALVSGGGADRAALADHVSLAGRALPPDPGSAAWLAAMAATAGTDRAVRWLRAALWHAGDGPGGERIRARLLPLLVRTGRYADLAEVVAATPEGTPDAPDLTVAAALATVHTGAPWSEDDQYAWWFDGTGTAGLHFGSTLASPAELAAARWAVRGGPGGPPRPLDDRLLAAGGAGDLVAVLGLALGPRYGPPAGGTLAAYHRIRRSLDAGDLPAVLSAARAVRATGAGGVVPDLARLLAAEAHALAGDARLAARWLASVPHRPATLAMRAWVACGLAERFDGDTGAALRDGWRAYERQRDGGGRVGVERLLPRLAALAVRTGEPDLPGRLLAEAEALRQRSQPWITAGTALLVRALACGDPSAARSAAGRLRRAGDRPALLEAYLAMGSVAAEPRPWLRQAYEAAGALRAPHARSRVVAVMRERGVPVPRARPRRAPLSTVERQVVELICAGRTNRQIAAVLRISEKTVENHLTRLFALTGCRSRVELAAATLSGAVLPAAPTHQEVPAA